MVGAGGSSVVPLSPALSPLVPRGGGGQALARGGTVKRALEKPRAGVARRKMRDAQRARRAAERGGEAAEVPRARRRAMNLNPAARAKLSAKLSAIARARWARRKAAAMSRL